jgi:Gas vesicle synthesis protein GvpL/GvpF
MKLYVYCVADREPVFARPLVGFANNEVEFLKFGELVVGASQFNGEVVEVNRGNVLLHDAVIREVFSQVTILPFRFGTSLTSESLESYMRSKHQPLAERLASLRNCIEMSVKIIWRNQVSSKPRNEKPDTGLGKGTAFLLAKREELLVDEKLEREARTVADWIKERLSEVVRKEHVSVQPKHKLVLSASYLIERGKETDFGQIVDKLRIERPDLHFLTSGPWPPYTFANIELEFETHFGVS